MYQNQFCVVIRTIILVYFKITRYKNKVDRVPQRMLHITGSDSGDTIVIYHYIFISPLLFPASDAQWLRSRWLRRFLLDHLNTAHPYCWWTTPILLPTMTRTNFFPRSLDGNQFHNDQPEELLESFEILRKNIEQSIIHGIYHGSPNRVRDL